MLSCLVTNFWCFLWAVPALDSFQQSVLISLGGAVPLMAPPAHIVNLAAFAAYTEGSRGRCPTPNCLMWEQRCAGSLTIISPAPPDL